MTVAPVYPLMAVPIRLQLLVTGKEQAIADVNDVATGIKSSMAGIGKLVSDSMGNAADSIKNNLTKIAEVSGIAFVKAFGGALGEVGRLNTAINEMNGNVEKLAATLSGMRFPSAPTSSIGSVVPTPSSIPSSTSATARATARAAGVSQAVLDEIQARNLQTSGAPIYAGTSQGVSRYDIPLRDPSGNSYSARFRTPAGTTPNIAEPTNQQYFRNFDVRGQNYAFDATQDESGPDQKGWNVAIANESAAAGNRFGMTGTGNAREVTRRSMEQMEKFITEMQPSSFNYTADSASRQRLYDRFIEKFEAMGYTSSTSFETSDPTSGYSALASATKNSSDLDPISQLSANLHLNRLYSETSAIRDKVASHLGPGSKILGAGQEAIAFETAEGDVIRIGNALNRLNVEGVLQPKARSVVVGGKQEWVIEQLEKLHTVKNPQDPDYTPQQDAAIDRLVNSITDQGLNIGDAHGANIGFTKSGEAKFIDPGVVTRPMNDEESSLSPGLLDLHKYLGDLEHKRQLAELDQNGSTLPEVATHYELRTKQYEFTRNIPKTGEQALDLSGQNLERIRPTSDGLISPETVNRTHEQIAAMMAEQGFQAVPGSESPLQVNQRGVLGTRDYRNAAGQLYQAQYRLQGEEETTNAMGGIEAVGGGAPLGLTPEEQALAESYYAGQGPNGRRAMEAIPESRFQNGSFSINESPIPGEAEAYKQIAANLGYDLGSFEKNEDTDQYTATAKKVNQNSTAPDYGSGSPGEQFLNFKPKKDNSNELAAEAQAKIEKLTQKAFEEQIESYLETLKEAVRVEKIGTANANNLKKVKKGGLGDGGIFSPSFQRTSESFDEAGNKTGATYERPASFFNAGSTKTFDFNTGQMTQQIQAGSSGISQLVQDITGNGGIISKVLNTTILSPLGLIKGAIGGVSSAWSMLGNNLIKVSALFYSFERVGAIIERAFLGPYRAIMKASEEAMKFRIAISGTVGGMGNAEAIDNQVIKLSRRLPLTIAQTRESARAMTDISSLAPRLAMATPDSAAGTIGQLTDVMARIATNNPEASQDAIVKSVENALLGNLRGLRLTARIDPSDLASISGLSQKQLQGDPAKILSAIQAEMRARVPDAALRERQNLPSVQWEKFTEQIQVGLMRIGTESGLFETIASRFHSMMEQLASYVDSPEFHERAQRIGDDLAHIFNNVLNAGARLLQYVSGAKDPADTPDRVAGQIEEFVRSIASGTDVIPAIATSIGRGLNSLVEVLQSFLAKVFLLAESADEKMARYDQSGFSMLAKIQNQNEQVEASHELIARVTGNPYLTTVEQTTADNGGVHGNTAFAIASSLSGNGGDAFKYLGTTDTAEQDPKYKALIEDFEEFMNANKYVARDGKFVSDQTIIQRFFTPELKKLGLPNMDPGRFNIGFNLPDPHSNEDPRDALDRKFGVTKSFKKSGVDDDLEASTPASLYFQKFSGVAKLIGEMGGKLPQSFDKLGEVMENEHRNAQVLTQKSKNDPKDEREQPGTFFDNVGKWSDHRVASLQEQQAGYEKLAHDLESQKDFAEAGSQSGELWTKLKIMIEKIDQDIDKTKAGLPQAIGKTLRGADAGEQKFKLSAYEAMKSGDPEIAAWEMSRLNAGQTEPQRDYSAIRSSGNSALVKAQLDEQARLSSQILDDAVNNPTSKNLAEIAKWMVPISGVATRLAPKQSGAAEATTDEDALAHSAMKMQLETSVNMAKFQAQGERNFRPEGNSLFFGQGVQGQQLDYLQDRLQPYQQHLADAQKAFNADPKSEKAARELKEAGIAVDKLQGQIAHLKLTLNTAGEGFIEFGIGIQNALEKSIGSAITDLITRTGQMKDVFKAFARDIVNSLSQMTSHTITDAIFGAPDKGGTSGIGGIFGSLLRLGGGAGKQTDAGGEFGGSDPNDGEGAITHAAGSAGNGLIPLITKGVMSLFAADGAVWPGFTPFAGGGVVHKPTYGLVGERADRTPEGIVPLLGPGHTMPLGLDSSGPHAILPGGRKIAASFANGGITGGFTAFAEGGVTGGGMASYHSGGSSSSAKSAPHSVTIYNVTSIDEAVQKGYDKNKGHLLNETLSEARPGGKLRMMLGRS